MTELDIWLDLLFWLSVLGLPRMAVHTHKRGRFNYLIARYPLSCLTIYNVKAPVGSMFLSELASQVGLSP